MSAARALLSFLLLVFLGLLLTVFLIFSIGLWGTIGWHFAMLLSFSAIVGSYLLIRRRRMPDIKTVKTLIVELILFIAMLEVPVILLAPTNSALPLGALAAMGIAHDARGGPCDIETKVAEANAFYRGAVDYNHTKIVFGGMPKYFGLRSAMTIEDTIYIEEPPSCISLETFVHESTHIWQFQTGYRVFRGVTGPFRLASWLIQQATDPRGLYDYGGPSGLASARAQGKMFVDFGIEQQAMIMQDYFRAVQGNSTDFYGRRFTADYKADLEYFAIQVIGLPIQVYL